MAVDLESAEDPEVGKETVSPLHLPSDEFINFFAVINVSRQTNPLNLARLNEIKWTQTSCDVPSLFTYL